MSHGPKDAHRHGPRDPALPQLLQPRQNRRRRPHPDRPTGEYLDFLASPGALVGSDHAGTADAGGECQWAQAYAQSPGEAFEASGNAHDRC